MARVRCITVVWALVIGVLAALAGPAGAQTQPEPQGQIERVENAIPDRYIVTLKSDDPAAVPVQANDLAAGHDAQVLDVYQHALQGFSAHMSEDEAATLAADPRVESVQEDGVVSIAATEVNPPSWGLDRIDQHPTQLDAQYRYGGDGSGVHAYVLDTGIRVTHGDFGGRASVGIDLVGDGNGPACAGGPTKAGHGTHVAGTLGGSAYGVAKNVSLVSVRVLDCDGFGDWATMIDGVDWVTEHAVKPAVVNMSVGGPSYAPFEDAVANSIASGLTYVVAAGNTSTNACQTSPADVPAAITVAATNTADSRDLGYSNYGPCVDLFAPGTSIRSDFNSGDSATAVMSGTSMATPHVAGAAALYLAGHPLATPDEVATALTGQATAGVVANAGTGSPNLLLYSGALPGTAPGPFTATGTSAKGKAKLAWTPPVFDGGNPVTAYRVYRGTTSGGEGPMPIATVDAGTSTFDDTTGVAGTPYFYQVAAVNAVGETRSAELSATAFPPTAPDAPAVVAVGGNDHVDLTWSTPDDGGKPITNIKVLRSTTSGAETLLPGGTLAGTATSFTDSTVDNGTTYFYEVTAQNALGSTTSVEVSATPQTSLGAYFPLTPARLMDTRIGNGLSGRFTGGVARSLQVTGRGGVPASGVSAVVLNLTVGSPSVASHVTVWPTGTSLPTASNLNFVAGEVRANLVSVRVGTGGKVNFQLNAGSADLVADVVGWYGDGTGAGASGSRYSPQSPYRILDSRIGTGGYSTPWGPGTTRDLSLPGVPDDATAVVLNVTATNPTAATFATVWPSDVLRPDPASNINLVPGQTSPNLVIVGIGANRKVSLYNNAGTIDFIADVVGWYGGTSATMVFTPAPMPTRLLDSRIGTGGYSTPWSAGQTRDLTIAGTPPVPAGATAAVLNVTVGNPTSAGFVSVFPSGDPLPTVSNLNFVPGQAVPNLVMVKINTTNKKVSFYNVLGSTDLVADVVGWFTAPS
jgi:subtilisin family serine protease